MTTQPPPRNPALAPIAIVALAAALGISAILGRVQTAPAVSVAPVSTAAAYPVGSEPDPVKTPGDVFPNVTAQDVCTPGYAGKTRNVPQSEKDAVYREYGIETHKPGEFEIDHNVSLELGGTNDIRNLWPQSYVTTPYNAHVKDKYEDWLHAQVCAGKITLAEAQSRIRQDWIAHAKADGVIQ